jgi:selenocysteine-specific elongation factor
MEYPFILGTAGHIDHGKTSLVRAMTGIDCDRLEEEKRRGITIELGFAPLTLSSGKTVSIVDVPGHERFIRQMAAGAAGMDAAMLVIAASEGVMPQTREHLDILDILGVRFGLVALTKKDLVDDETLQLAVEEALEVTQGTCLEGAPIVPVSSLTGDGIPRILETIAQIIEKVPPRNSFGAFFLPIDRVFSKKGFGSVVTGTSYQGSTTVGDEVNIMPSSTVAKVRSLQTHGAAVPSVTAGQRVAVNLASISQDQLERGDAVCAKGAFIATDCMNTWLEVLPSAPHGLTHWQRVRLHVGTADVVARVSLLRMADDKKKQSIAPGSSGPAQLLTESKITVAAGQRFVIRFYSPLITIGGGRILLPNADTVKGRAERAAKSRILEELAGDFNAMLLLASIVRDKGILGASSLFALSQMDKGVFEETVDLLSAASDTLGLIEFGASRHFISADAFDTVARSVLRLLKGFHTKYPERAGIDAEKLFASLDAVHGADTITGSAFKELLALMASRGIVSSVMVQNKTCYSAAGHNASVDKKLTELVERIRTESAVAGFNLAKLSELEASLSAAPSDMKRAMKYLQENDHLRIIDGGFVLPHQTLEQLLDALASMQGDITVASLRDTLGVNRKQSLSMLDFLDSQGFTQRDGDKRLLRQR